MKLEQCNECRQPIYEKQDYYEKEFYNQPNRSIDILMFHIECWLRYERKNI